MSVFYRAKHMKPRVNWKKAFQWTMTFLVMEILFVGKGVM